MKKLVLFSAFAFFAYASYAQVIVGATAGVNFADINQDYAESSDELETSMRIAPKLGVVADFFVADALTFRTGLTYTGKGFRSENSESADGFSYENKIKYAVSYLEIPLTGVYKTGSFEITAGPYVAFGIGGKVEFDYSMTYQGGSQSGSESMNIGFTGEVSEAQQEEEDKAYMKGLDAGFILGVGYNVGPGVLGISYTKGLANLTPKYAGSTDDPADEKVTNTVIGISYSYFFNK